MGPQPANQPANQSRYRSRGCWLFLIWIKTKREGSRLHLGTRFTWIRAFIMQRQSLYEKNISSTCDYANQYGDMTKVWIQYLPDRVLLILFTFIWLSTFFHCNNKHKCPGPGPGPGSSWQLPELLRCRTLPACSPVIPSMITYSVCTVGNIA
jgi:hypothetical protein